MYLTTGTPYFVNKKIFLFKTSYNLKNLSHEDNVLMLIQCLKSNFVKSQR